MYQQPDTQYQLSCQQQGDLRQDVVENRLRGQVTTPAGAGPGG